MIGSAAHGSTQEQFKEFFKLSDALAAINSPSRGQMGGFFSSGGTTSKQRCATAGASMRRKASGPKTIVNHIQTIIRNKPLNEEITIKNESEKELNSDLKKQCNNFFTTDLSSKP